MELSNRPFRHPLSLADLQIFCHPRHEIFRQPVRLDGGVCVANGYLALRITRGPVTFDDQVPPASEEFAQRFRSLPWHLVEPDPRLIGRPQWRAFDDARGTIYRGGPLSLWIGGRFTESVPVLLAASTLVPLALIQQIARLPRCEVRMSTGDHLAIRFSGGEGIIPFRWRHSKQAPTPKFSLFLTGEQLEQLRDRAKDPACARWEGGAA